MITAADSNVLVDIAANNPMFLETSLAALRRARREGIVIVSEVVWAEVLTGYADPRQGLKALTGLGVRYVAMGVDAANIAAAAWRQFRMGGGTRRERILPDFLIGAHAVHHAERLLTRDRGVYRAYFPDLELLDPAAS